MIVLPEVFGWAGRLRGISDSLAKEGYLALMPDCHRGDTAAGKADIPTWVAQTPWDPLVKADMEVCFEFAKSKGCTKFSAIGFCWGAWAWAKAASNGFGFACCVGAHPSIKLEEFAFGSSIMEMVEGVSCPCLLLAGGNDPDNVKPGGEFAKVFEAKGGKSIAFEDMQHGWVSRGDVGDEKIKEGVKRAMEESLAFLKANM